MAIFVGATQAYAEESTKQERNLIKEGNKLFNEGNYAKALKLYNEALNETPNSEAAKFNRATALTKLSSEPNDTLAKQASEIYKALSQSAASKNIKEKASYNLGNQEFHRQNYQGSIDYYKEALRINPANEKTRQNLLVAQLKLQQQQNQQDQQDQQQDQQQQQQQEQQQQQQEQQEQQQQQPPQQPQEQKEMSGNAEQILQTMQNRENQTRENAKKEEMNAIRRSTDKPW